MAVHARSRLRSVIAATAVTIGMTAPSYAQEFKATFVSPLWGLRVQTDTPGGLVGSFGANGDFRIDAAAISGGRFAVKENGNVGIGIPNPAQKLSVAGMVESTSGGFKFPDGSIQTSAIASGGSYIQNTTSQQAGANFNIAGSGIVGGSLGVGVGAAGAPLHVSSAASDATSIMLDNTSNGLRRMYLSTYGSAGGGVYWAGLNSANTSSLFAPGLFVLRSGDGIVFSGSSQVEHMRLHADGHLSLGSGYCSPCRASVTELRDNGTGIEVIAFGQNGTAVMGQGTAAGVSGWGPGANGTGVVGRSNIGTGVKGWSEGGLGISAKTLSGPAAIDALNESTSGFSDGVRATSNSGAAVGIWARNLAASGTAGRFDGNVAVYGTLTKSGGSFKIDHPLDPENKFLFHSFVESPDMMNIYNGNVTTGADGTAEVAMPDWFQALNQEFRYQLTCIGTFAQAIIAEEIRDNRFVIKTSLPRVKVSWQVTGIRHDPWAEQHRIQVEAAKPDAERGYYLHPDVYGQPAERSTAAARTAEAEARKK